MHLPFEHSDFEFVSDFDIRISDFSLGVAEASCPTKENGFCFSFAGAASKITAFPF